MGLQIIKNKSYIVLLIFWSAVTSLGLSSCASYKMDSQQKNDETRSPSSLNVTYKVVHMYSREEVRKLDTIRQKGAPELAVTNFKIETIEGKELVIWADNESPEFAMYLISLRYGLFIRSAQIFTDDRPTSVFPVASVTGSEFADDLNPTKVFFAQGSVSGAGLFKNGCDEAVARSRKSAVAACKVVEESCMPILGLPERGWSVKGHLAVLNRSSGTRIEKKEGHCQSFSYAIKSGMKVSE